MRVELDPDGKNAPLAERFAKENGSRLAITVLMDKSGLMRVQAWGDSKELDVIAETLGIAIAQGLNDVAKLYAKELRKKSKAETGMSGDGKSGNGEEAGT